MLRFETVSKRYPGGQDALAELSFALAAGEFAFLTGHSGAGKSTVLRLIALAEQPTRGAVYFNDQRLSQLRAGQVPFLRRQIGQVYQDHRLLMTRTTLDNVSLPLVIAGMGRVEREKRARAALDVVGLLDRERALPGQLSAGEQQRVGVARAIVALPPLVIADEPTGNLDPDTSERVFAELIELIRTSGLAALIATHNHDIAKRMDRVLRLEHGKLVEVS